MVRRFELRDSLLIQRLTNQGICFDTRTALTSDLHLLRNAVAAGLFPSLLPETHVIDRAGKPFGFAQLSHPRGSPTSRLRFYAPREIGMLEPGSGLMESLLSESGRRFAQYLLAEAEEGTEQFGFLRREGFAVYARQDIWKGTAAPAMPSPQPEGNLRPLQAADRLGVLGLYSSVVPALVQQVEGLPRPLRGWGLIEEGELVGVFLTQIGTRGLWMEPILHPGARHVAEWTAALIAALNIHSALPLHVCVRSYQDWLGAILRDFQFSLCGEQAVMARRVVVPVPAGLAVSPAVIEGGVPNVTSIQNSARSECYDSSTTNHR
jgi:hypothetical protein